MNSYDVDTELSVSVSNVSLNATSERLCEFMVFCGDVKKLLLYKVPDEDFQRAVVEYDNLKSCETAQILTNTIILDRAIVVSKLKEGFKVNEDYVHDFVTFEISDTSMDSSKKSTSVITSLLASGYILGEDVLEKAKSIDEKYLILLHLKVGKQIVKQKATKISDSLELEKKAATIGQGVEVIKAKTSEWFSSIESRWKIGENLGKLKDNVLSNETVSYGLSTIQNFGSLVSYTVKEKVSQGLEEIETVAEQKRVESKKYEVKEMKMLPDISEDTQNSL